MPEQQPPSHKPLKIQQPQEFNMERSLLLMFLLVGASMFVLPYILPQPPENKAAAKPKSASAPANPKPNAAKPDAAGAASQSAVAGTTAVAGTKEEQFHFDQHALHDVVVSNRGAAVTSWKLKKYKDSNGKPLELVHQRSIAKVGYPLSIAYAAQRPETDLNYVVWAHRFLKDGYGVEFEYADAKVRARKLLRFRPNDYRVEVVSEVYLNGAGLPHNLNWKGGFGDTSVYNAAANGRTVRFDTELRKKTVKETKEGAPVSDRGTYVFGGIEDTYFAAVFLPKVAAQAFDVRTYADTVKNSENRDEQFAGVSVGGNPTNEFALYVGPKDVETLGQVDQRLEQLIDWGWFWWVAKPLFGGVMQVHKWVRTWAPSGAYGWALIIVTIIINFALLPLKISALKSSKKMSALQPDIARINKKYEGIGLQDPRRNQQNEEIMGLYKKHNVNPVGGCVPLLLQMPFLFAFLQVLQVAVQMRQADWLWVKDLSQPETIPIRLLPLAMVATQYILQRMTPTPSVDPAQQRMLQLMPLMFAVFFYNAQSGLVLYWLVGNLIALVQQWAFNKFL